MKLFRQIPGHWYVITSAWLSKIITIAAQLFAVRLIIGILGEERYAVFVLAMALLNWVLLIDMGLGSSLQNAISTQRATNEKYTNFIATSLIILIPVTLCWLFIFSYISQPLSEYYFSEYQSLTKTDNNFNLIFVAVVLFSGITLGTVANKIWYAEQAGWKANIIISIGWILGLPSVYLSNIYLHYNSTTEIFIAFYLPQTLIGLGSFLYFLIYSYEKSFILDWKSLKQFLRRAIGFWLFFLACAFAIQSDYIIMSQHIKGQEIVQYSIVSKIFSVTGFMFNAILAALWPICAEAAALKKWGTFFRYSKKYIKIGIAFILLCTIGIYILRGTITNILAPNENIYLPALMIFLFGVYQTLRIWCDTFGVLLLSLNRLKPTLVLYSAQAILGILFQWYGSIYFGYIGLLSGLILSLLFTTIWGLPYILFSYIRKQQEESTHSVS